MPTTPEGRPPAETLFDENFWDERYSGSHAVWSGNPNPQLLAEMESFPTQAPAIAAASAARPGWPAALDVGCGEGADSIWLARRGWHVTAVDISRVALQKAEQHAMALELPGSIAWEHHDLLAWAPPAAAFDLVNAQFMHLPSQDRIPVFARLAAAVAAGGTLLVVGHSSQDILAGAKRPNAPDLYFTAAEVAASLDPQAWRVEVAEARPRSAAGVDGETITIHDEVLRAVRIATS